METYMYFYVDRTRGACFATCPNLITESKGYAKSCDALQPTWPLKHDVPLDESSPVLKMVAFSSRLVQVTITRSRDTAVLRRCRCRCLFLLLRKFPSLFWAFLLGVYHFLLFHSYITAWNSFPWFLCGFSGRITTYESSTQQTEKHNRFSLDSLSRRIIFFGGEFSIRRRYAISPAHEKNDPQTRNHVFLFIIIFFSQKH